MGDQKKASLAKSAALASAARTLLNNPVVRAAGLPPGVSVQTNAAQNARFPLPLTIGSALFAAVGVVAAVRGHKIVGGGIVLVGLAGLAAAAAAPELNKALAGVQGTGT